MSNNRSVTLIACVLLLCTNSATEAAPPATAPNRSWTIADFGAASDGKTKATDAIQATINACATAGGGRVIVPAGTYLSGPIQLRSDVELHLDAGATLLFSRNFEDYALAMLDDGSGPEPECRSPVWGENLSNVSITGGGIIDGQGDGWRQVKKEKLSAAAWDDLVKSGGALDARQTTWYPNEIARDSRDELKNLEATTPALPLSAFEKYRPMLRPRLIRLSECHGVLLEGATFRNSAMWNVHLSLCDNVIVRHVTIFNPSFAQNGDGIDIDSCRDVLITDTKVNAGDDGICLKCGMNEWGRKRARPTENVTITHCTVGTGHGGVVIGSEMSGGVRNVNVSDCTFDGTDNGLRFKSTRGRGGVVENVNVDRIQMSGIHGDAILFDLYYMLSAAKAAEAGAAPVGDGTPIFRQFSIHNVTCNGAKRAFQLRGLPEMPLQGLVFENVHIEADQAGVISDVKNVSLKDVKITARDGSKVAVSRAENFVADRTEGIALP